MCHASSSPLSPEPHTKTTNLRQGQERVVPVSGGLAEIQHSDPWDGKDGEVQQEDEFSLEDLMGEEEKAEL